MSTINMYCIYHSRDLDGWMSAAIVMLWYERAYGDLNGLVLIGWDYGNPIPVLATDIPVIMVDISFPLEEMKRISKNANGSLIWIDHHKSAIIEFMKDDAILSEQWLIAELPEMGIGEEMELVGACELAWRHLFQDEKMPEIVRLLGCYDSFRHQQQWRAVVGYESIYEVSNHGNIRSLDRIIIESNTDVKRPIKGKQLSPAVSKRGYLVVVLCKDGAEKTRNVHQLVAEAFILNPENKPTVNHKDSNRLNNNSFNLEWNTYAENNEHGIKNGDVGYSVLQLDKDGVFINSFKSIKIAEEKTGVAHQNISIVCKGKRVMAGGFKWEYGLKKDTPQFIPQDEHQYVFDIQYAARTYLHNPEHCLTTLKDHKMLDLITWQRIGSGILSYLKVEARSIYKNRMEFMIAGYKAAAINRERFNPSSYDIKYHEDGYDLFMCYSRMKDGRWIISLYNENKKVDVSVLAKQFGGGGHSRAAGFVTEDADFIDKYYTR